MNEYIKIKPLVDLIQSRIDYQSKLGLTERIEAYNDVLDMIGYSKFDDVEEVTRCKDCYNSEVIDGCYGECRYCHYYNHNVDDDDFCSQGG